MYRVGNKIVFSDEDKNEIVRLYVDEGWSMPKICAIYNIAKTNPIARVLDEYNIDHSRGNLSAFKPNYPDDIYDELEEKYVQNIISQIPSCKQKYKINDRFFDDLRNPNVVYIIGFLYADGCNRNETYVTLSLEERDYEILKKINDILENESPLRFEDKSNKHDFGYDYENQYQVAIYNKRIAKVLSVLGVVPRKSLILKFPKWLHPSMYSHFIRGVYDGDGSIYRYYNDNGIARNTTLTLTSTEQFCRALIDISAKYIGIKSNIYDASCHNGITKVFQLTGYNVCKKFLDWLYLNSNLHLKRKYERYCEYYPGNKLDKAIIV